jgi:hypothetical protein
MTTEIKEKAKRGRPPVMSNAEYLHSRALWSDRIETRRGLLNKHYEIIAFGIIREMISNGITGLEFISDPIKEKNNWGVLRELGRFDEESIRIMAPAICEAQKQPDYKRTVHEWGDYLRGYRLHPERLSETVSENSEVTK